MRKPNNKLSYSPIECCNVMRPIGSSYPTKVTCLFVEPLRLTVDVQLTHFLLLQFLVLSVIAPRLVLMRCTTRSEVVFFCVHFYFRSLHVLQIDVITEETLKCPVGKVPIKSLFSSSNHSLFSKACLFPAIGFAVEISASYRRVTRQNRCLKNF